MLACGLPGIVGASPAALDVFVPTKSPHFLLLSDQPRALLPRRIQASQHLRGGSDLVRCNFEVRVQCKRPEDTVVLIWAKKAYEHHRCPYQKWDQGKSNIVELTARPTDPSRWGAEVAVPVGDTVVYKFALRSQGGRMSWEPGPNRRSVIPDQHGAVLSSVFGDTMSPATSENVHPLQRLLESLLAQAAGFPGAQAVKNQLDLPGLLAMALTQAPAAVANVTACFRPLCAAGSNLVFELAQKHWPALLAHAPLAAMLLWDVALGPYRFPTRTQGVYASRYLHHPPPKHGM